jgi:hypothetical protein
VNEIENFGFGPILAAKGSSAHGSNHPNARVDAFQVTVYYSRDPGPGVLFPEADTYLREQAADQNEKNATILRVKSNDKNRALVRMNQQAIVDFVGSGQVTAATLELYIEYNNNAWGSGREVDIHRVEESWTELGATLVEARLLDDRGDTSTSS